MAAPSGTSGAVGLSLGSWTLFASSGPLGRSLMDSGWSPAAVPSGRVLVAAVLLLPFVAVVRPQALRFRRRDMALLPAYGLLGIAGVQLLFFLAVSRVSVGVAMVLVNLAPTLVALWVRIVRRTPLPRTAWLGIAVAVAGLAVVAQIWQGSRLGLLGVAAGLGSAACSASYFLVGEHAARRHDPLGVTVVGLVVGALALAVLCPPWTLLLGSLDASTRFAGAPVPTWSVLLVLATVATVLPYLAGLHTLRVLSPTPAGVLAVVEPVVATLLAWLLLGQTLGPAQLVGTAAMLGGAALVQVTARTGSPSGPSARAR